jgi:hypothetical protein
VHLQQIYSKRSPIGCKSRRSAIPRATRDQDQAIEIPRFDLWKTGESRTDSGRSAANSGISGVLAGQSLEARAFYVLQTFLSMTAGGPVPIKRQLTPGITACKPLRVYLRSVVAPYYNAILSKKWRSA